VPVIGSGKHAFVFVAWWECPRLTSVNRNYYWRQNPNATAYIQASEGLFIGEIVQRLEQVIHHNMTQRYGKHFLFIHLSFSLINIFLVHVFAHGKHCVLTQLCFFR